MDLIQLCHLHVEGAEETIMPESIYDVPSDVAAKDGAVTVNGPDGVAVSFTPEAAADTSDRLLDAAATAQGQRIEQAARNHLKAGDTPI